MNKELIIQFCLVLAVAAGTVWLGEIWRNEGRTFVQEKEKEGGIEKAKLVKEAEIKQNEIIETYEAEARRERGMIEGQAIAEAEERRARGGVDRAHVETVGERAQAYAIETTQGLQIIADRLLPSIPDAATAQTVNLYFRKAIEAQSELQRLAWAPRFDCTQGKEKAVAIASALAGGASRSVLDKY